MEIQATTLSKPQAGICGHIGVGHAYSHSGFMQDDSVGFASIVALLRRAHPMDFSISSVEVQGDTVSVTTAHGGRGAGRAARGFSPSEKELVQRIVHQESLVSHNLAPQSLATYAFGRVYGQGVSEAAAALSLAIANAYMDTIQKHWPHPTLYAPENIEGCCGSFLGGCITLQGQTVAWLLAINATDGGIGPIEDAEGTIPLGKKGELMRQLGIDLVPTLILESKAFVPAMSQTIQQTTYFGRWNKDWDNPIVGNCLRQALEESALPFYTQDNAYPRDTSLYIETKRIGQEIATLGAAYASATTSRQKVLLAANLAQLVSHDLGGSIFMSDAIFSIAGGGGLWPGHGAVLSILATAQEAQELVSMTTTNAELESMADISLTTLSYILMHHAEATRYVHERRPDVSCDDLLAMAHA